MNEAATDVSPGAEQASPAPVTGAEDCHCGHPDAEHDAVARRYCAATSSAGLHRGCICRAAPRKPYRYR